MSAQDRLAGLIEFVRTVQEGSFTAAGTALGSTGSAVGKSVSRLEARLGVKLLHRTTRRVTPTSEGEVYYEIGRRLLDDLDDVEQRLTSGRGEPVGRVRIDLPGAFGRRHVLPVLRDVAARHARLDLSIMFSERTADVVGEGIDLAVRIGELDDDPEMIATRLGRQRLVICAAPGYLAARGVPADPAALADHDGIVGWRRTTRPVWLVRGGDGSIGRVPVRVRHEMSDGEAMLSLVLGGGGLCQLPTWLVADHLAAGALVTVLDDQAGAEMPIHAVWPRSRYAQLKVRTIVDALRRHAATPGSGFDA